MKKWIGIVSGLLLFIVLHSTPHLALRTKVFFMGYPADAFTTGIVNYEYEKEVNGGASSSLNGKTYTLTEPPVEKATQGELRNYLVKKVGFLYFAEYFGEG
ncbi:hypothetical protein [Bacillus sp. Marseille-Q1617]|uniref:hypothetical protein n=1 Tax=Bacillus sp. Marseille-Q1617 TaxID=2736887 RepID=UPI00158D18CE|nr:hypothetical protein [Bacillus sp. Marseille-Q1617]